jgi:DNA mismatch repair protein MutL
VRFRRQSFVHDFVRDTIRERLIETRPAPAFSPAASAQPGARMPYSEFSQMLVEQAEVGQASWPVSQPVPPPAPDTHLPDFALRPAAGPAPRLDFGGPAIALVDAPAAVRLRMPETHGAFPLDALPVSDVSLGALSDLRPLGQLHESFIIAAGRSGLWIVDQHVAHERILFERVLKQRAAGNVETQRLLMPLIVQLTPGQQIEYARIADELNAIGFESEPFGNRTIAVTAAPAAVGPADLETVLAEILETAEAEFRGLSLEDVRRSIAASIACHAAIKINTRLDHTKMEWLLRAVAATDCPMSCPHGRPIALQYSMREILKAFHRI